MGSLYPEFVLTDIICIEKHLKGTEIVFVLPVFVLTRFYSTESVIKYFYQVNHGILGANNVFIF